ncbi:penicillin-binding protein 1C [Marinagarivorans cellulosilyticus]|uniref:peptidoglycan glycosyltransferase n=2 Tax=Marinagarivorans cellulosilyticus TaxID=2721545 RepID=A0AAN2BM04_9GAMM|nr:penicillin-binding protein 1C [Marinagarivorans cellulosilyticus]
MRLNALTKKTKCLLAFIAAGPIAFGVFLLCNQLLPLPMPNTQSDFARVVTDQHGEPLRVFADGNGVWRYPVTQQAVSPLYLQALINYEDRWFYQHPGVNPLSLIRALGQWLMTGDVVSGGSTITMQVARILEPHSRSLFGKCWQMFRALQLEWQFDKNQILELYLNYAPFGGTLEGVQAASFTYFGKSALQLTHAEAAMLAVLPQAPSRLRPDRHPMRAEKARNKVLNRLAAFKVWPNKLIQEAFAEPVIAQFNSHPKMAPLLARRLIQQYPTQQTIKTTVNRQLQRNLERTVKQYIHTFPEGTSAAVLVLNNQNLTVQAYVGSADFNNNARFGHVDMVSAIRSPGSTLKPFLYGIALDQGLIHEQSLLLDVPSEFGQYKPQNFNQGFSGPVSVRAALQRSLNVPAVQVLDALGPNAFYAHLRSAGIKLHTVNNQAANLSLILGGASTSLEDLTQAFAIFGRAGLTQPISYLAASPSPHSTKNNKSPNQARRILSPEAAWITANIMAGASLSHFETRRAIATNTLEIPFKTGTSYGFRDAWVLASTKDLTFGIWVGRPDGTPLTDNYGRQNAVPLLRRVLTLLPAQQLTLPPKPKNVTRNTICWPLGTLKLLQDPNWCMREKSAWLINQQAPANTLADPLDSYWAGNLIKAQLNANGEQTNAQCAQPVHSIKTFAVWPSSLELWLPQKWRRTNVLPPWARQCQQTLALQKLKINGINPNSTLTPSYNGTSLPEITATTTGFNGKLHWFLDGQWRGEGDSFTLSGLENGRHKVSVIDGAGQMDEVVFSVME